MLGAILGHVSHVGNREARVNTFLGAVASFDAAGATLSR